MYKELKYKIGDEIYFITTNERTKIIRLLPESVFCYELDKGYMATEELVIDINFSSEDLA